MKIKEVTTKEHIKDFLELAPKLYKDNAYWIRPLDKDIEAVFNQNKNKYFRHGECKRWILLNGRETVGRIAAFYSNKTKNKHTKVPLGGVGFFECINDQKTANLLFDVSKKWLQSKGIEAMDGLINFGDRDRFWGVLTKGFNKEPNYLCNYNFPYYSKLLNEYGFKLYYNQVTYGRLLSMPLDEKIEAKSNRINRNSKYTFEHFKESKIQKYIEDFYYVYTKAWSSHKGVASISLKQIESIMKSLKPIIDEKIMWYAYFDGRPIGFFFMLPDVNQIFKNLNGKMNWIQKIRLLYYKKNRKCNKIVGTVFGVIPEFQGRGVEGAIIKVAADSIKNSPYKYLEMNWIGDFNPKMLHVCEQVGAERVKNHCTYRYHFNTSITVDRHPILN